MSKNKEGSPGLSLVALGLGANLGEREKSIQTAIDKLACCEEINLVATAPLIETAPVGGIPQPHYINSTCLLTTSLSPRELLEVCQRIEVELGRNREEEEKWGPRTIDLDILLFGGTIVDSPDLRVPHPEMHRRRFVLEPLCEIAPEMIHPELHVTVRYLLNSLISESVTCNNSSPFCVVPAEEDTL